MFKTEHYKKFIPGFPLNHVLVGASYDHEMQKKIHRFKFAKNPVDRVYFTSIFQRLKEEFEQIYSMAKFPSNDWIIVFPPISFFDRVMRGSNHAKTLATCFRNKDDLKILCPFKKKLLAGHQARRSREDRKKVQEEYVLLSKYIPDIRGKNVIFVDDLITTGYTARVLGNFLKKAGAKEIIGFFLSSEKV